MYKIRKKQDDNSLMLKMSKNYLDQDSGIVTTAAEESDMERQRPNYIFSDDDDEVNQALNSLGDIHNIPQQEHTIVFNSPSYYMNLADQAVMSIRYHLNDSNWKKVLKHKSGTTVHMLQNTQDKTALFRGESVIKGFTPQSIFYVIGMRKLWDEQFEEGNLIENLNDTTSLTYESYKSTATSKGYDLTLVEKIECSAEGEILFACTSVDTPKVPKTSGKNRNQIKLQGWILKQLNTSPVSTKITYITQENIKGWIPGLTKKSLARKPLIITSIDNYLKQKSDRLRFHQQQHISLPKSGVSHPSISSLSTNTIPNSNNNTNSEIHLIKSPRKFSTTSILQQHHNNSDSSYSLSADQQTSPTLGPSAAPIEFNNMKMNTIILSNPPPRISSLSSMHTSSIHTKHISFSDDVTQQQQNERSDSPMSSSAYTTSSSSARSSYETEEQRQQYDTEIMNEQSNSISPIGSPPPLVPSHHHPYQQLSPIHEIPPIMPFSSSSVKKKDFSSKAIAGSKLYPASRHRNARKQCIDQLKSYLASDINEWKSIGDHSQNNRTKIYTKSVEGSTLPILRSDSTFYGSWTPEQICSVIQCFGARKIWDIYFEDGHVVERFSQKEYLIYTQMKSMFPIQSRDFSILTCIESNVSSGTIYIASTSVKDELIPDTPPHIRGSFMTYGWILEPLRSTQHRLIGVKSTFIAHLDMGGSTPLPPSIARALTTEVPSCVDRIQAYLRQHGCPPYIRRVAGKIIFEEFNDSDKQYNIQFIAKHTPSARQYRSRNSTTMIQSMWCTDLRTHLSMYPFGYTIETQPEYGIRIEMRPDAMGFRIYTEKDDMDGQTIQVFIRQNRDGSPGSKPLFIWNGTRLLDDTTHQKALPVTLIKKSKDTMAHVEKDQLVTTTHNSVHHMIDNDDTRPVTIATKTNEHIIKVNNNNEKDKVENQRRNSHLVVFSEELTFTGHQFSFLILLMAICYYLGKFSCRCSI